MSKLLTGHLTRPFSWTAALLLSITLAACGGGGGGGSGSGGSGSGGSTASATSASGGSSNASGNGSSGTTVSPPASNLRSGPNVVNISVDNSVFNAVNEPFVSVTICSSTLPANCLTVDHILVDTGSVGLRIFDQPSNSTTSISDLQLPAKLSAGSSGLPVGECLQFVASSIWGPVKLANVTIGQKTVSNLAFEVIATANTKFNPAPASCGSPATLASSGNGLVTDPTTFGANGVLGIGLTRQDCGPDCAPSTNNPPSNFYYYSCPVQATASCTNIAVALADQVQNPVSAFATDNNGVILTLNSIPSNGVSSTVGTLTFGIDTEANNVSGNSNTIFANRLYDFTTTYAGHTYNNSYLDSGSNGLFFNAPTPITQCGSNAAGFYCPAAALNNETAIITGDTGSTTGPTITFNIYNANVLFNTNNAGFNNLAGTASDSSTFDWGLPFFFGRDVYIAFENSTTNKTVQPAPYGYYGF